MAWTLVSNANFMCCQHACRALSVAACGGVTDAALAAVPPGVRALNLVCCERVSGWGLTRLRALRTLRLSGCSAIELRAVQARLIACEKCVHDLCVLRAVHACAGLVAPLRAWHGIS